MIPNRSMLLNRKLRLSNDKKFVKIGKLYSRVCGRKMNIHTWQCAIAETTTMLNKVLFVTKFSVVNLYSRTPLTRVGLLQFPLDLAKKIQS